MSKLHHYALSLEWTGNKGAGTDGYRNYERSYTIRVENKPDLYGSSDPMFRGDRAKYNPEEMLVAALSSCHMLSFLHCCVNAGVVVTDYRDEAGGTMVLEGDGGRFTEVVLRPTVTVTVPEMVEKIRELHEQASRNCFIASSVNFPVRHEPVTLVAG